MVAPQGRCFSASFVSAWAAKERACEELIWQRELECRKWFDSKFRGQVYQEPAEHIVKIYSTSDYVPFGREQPWFEPIHLNWRPPVYRCLDLHGWALREDWRGFDTTRGAAVTVAARRKDAARPPGEGESGEGNWCLAQRLGSEPPSAPRSPRAPVWCC